MAWWRCGGFWGGPYRQGYGCQGLGQKWASCTPQRSARSGAPRILSDGLAGIFIASKALPRDAFTKSPYNKNTDSSLISPLNKY